MRAVCRSVGEYRIEHCIFIGINGILIKSIDYRGPS